MIFNWYLGLLYLPGGQCECASRKCFFFKSVLLNRVLGYLSVLLNSFVHIIMYSYYFLAAFGARAQKFLWWKKYLTQIQLVSFELRASLVATPGGKILN